MPSDSELQRLAQDPALSDWFRNALVEALKRDPVDAAQDAGMLALVLDRRASELLSISEAEAAIAQAAKR